MRVALLTPYLSSASGGLMPAIAGLAAALAAIEGCEPHVVGIEDRTTAGGWPQDPRVAQHAVPYLGPRMLGWAPGLGRILRQLGPDIVHAQGLWMYPSLASLMWHRRSGRPYLISPHGMLDPWAVARSRSKKQLAASLFEDRHLRGAACLHALNVAEAEAIRAFGLTNPICVVPNAVTLPELRPDRNDGRVKKLLFMGRLHQKKGLRELVKAWSLVRDVADREGWCLEIRGWAENSYGAEVQGLVSDLGLGHQISLPGPCFGAEKDLCFREAAAFVLTSFSEGLPMAVLEAWSYGLPALITPPCNLPEGAQAGAAMLVEPEPISIASGLSALFALDDGQRRRMGAAGRDLVETRFTWPRVAGSMHDVYRWALEGGEPPESVVLP